MQAADIEKAADDYYKNIVSVKKEFDYWWVEDISIRAFADGARWAVDKKDCLPPYSSLENYLLANEDKLQLPRDWGMVAKAAYDWLIGVK